MHWLARNSTLFLLVFALPVLLHAQEDEFSFSQTSNTKITLEYNEDLAAALMNNDENSLKDYLHQHPKAINDASGFDITQGKYVSSKKVFKPLLYHVFELCLEGKKSTSLFNWVLQFPDIDLQQPFNEKPVFYHCLNFLATHKISECKKATEIFFHFIHARKFNVWDKYGILYQPIIYLLRTNYDFLQGTYQPDYLDPAILEAFLNQGENTNSYDQLGNNLLTYAVQARQSGFQNFLQEKGIVKEKKNKLGQDAFFAAIAAENIEGIRSMVSAGYAVSVEKMLADNIPDKLNLQNVALIDFLTQESLIKISSSQQLVAFLQVFPNRKNQLLAWSTLKSISMDPKDIPQFVILLENKQYPLEKQYEPYVLGLKQQYIMHSTDPESFCKAIKAFPLLACASCGTAYEVSESASKLFQQEIEGLASFTTDKFRNSLIQQVQQKTNEHFKSTLASARYVDAFVGIKVKYPSKASEVEQRCFSMVCSQPNEITFGYSQDAQRAISLLNARQQQMKEYVQHFSYRNGDVQTWLKSGPSFIENYEAQYNKARSRERMLKDELTRQLNRLDEEKYVPAYAVKEVDSKTLKIIITFGKLSHERTLNVSDKGEYYTGSIFTTDYASISEFVWQESYIYRSKWRTLTNENINAPDDIHSIEEILNHIRKFGIEKWYLSTEFKY